MGEPVSLEEWGRFASVYAVPDNMRSYMPRLFTEAEVRFALACPEVFDRVEAGRILASLDGDALIDVDAFLQREYSIGFLNYVDETETTWTLAGYRTYLDVWPVWENEEYVSRFTPEERADIDWKYFHQGFDPKGRAALEQGIAPSDDEVYTLAETLAWIKENNQPAYLSNCDCRSLAGDCDMPRFTCISYRHGINSYAHRGWSKKLSVEETLEAVKEFDRAGLMHTLNGTTICNCCGDCCYLSRGRDQIQSGPNWPLAHHVVAYDPNLCVGCGRCVKRCWRDVFARTPDRKVSVDASRCVGCGICETGCPKGALSMADAEYPGFSPKAEDPMRVYSH